MKAKQSKASKQASKEGRKEGRKGREGRKEGREVGRNAEFVLAVTHLELIKTVKLSRLKHQTASIIINI